MRGRAVVIVTGAIVTMLIATSLLGGCGRGGEEATPIESSTALSSRSDAFLDTLSERTFRFFWELSDPRTGLAPDRAPTESFASVAATGFALTAYPIGVERGYISRAAAADALSRRCASSGRRPRETRLRARSATTASSTTSSIPRPGIASATVELSTMDTALLLAGALFCQSYFDGADARRRTAIRALADSLYARVDWQWASVRPPTIGHGWTPGERPPALRLARLQRGDDPLPPGARLAHPPGRRRRPGRPGPRATAGASSTARSTSASRRSSATSTRTSGSTSAASATTYMRERGHRLLRELAPRRARPARLRHRESRRLARATDRDLWGLTACDGPVHRHVRDRRPRARSSTPTGRAARRSPASTTTARSAPSAAGGVDRLRAGDRHPDPASPCARPTASTSSPPTASSMR